MSGHAKTSVYQNQSSEENPTKNCSINAPEAFRCDNKALIRVFSTQENVHNALPQKTISLPSIKSNVLFSLAGYVN